MAINLPSPLSPATEAVVMTIIGCAIEVHRRLGPGFPEAIYEDAMAIELELQGLRFERQRAASVRYRERPLRTFRVDLVVEDQVVVEIKAVLELHPVHRAQTLSYLRASGLRVGLLINFNGIVIRGNFERVVL